MIGSINTSEFLVAVAASVGFFYGIGSENINLVWVAMLLAGGVIAAPVAALLVRYVPPRLVGCTVGGLTILTNARTLLRSDWIDAANSTRYGCYLAILIIWAAAFTHSVRQYRIHREADQAEIDAAAARRAALAG